MALVTPSKFTLFTPPASTYLIVGYVIYDYGTDEASDCSDAVRQAHQDTRVPGGNVQVVHIVTGNSEATARHSNSQGSDGTSLEITFN